MRGTYSFSQQYYSNSFLSEAEAEAEALVVLPSKHKTFASQPWTFDGLRSMNYHYFNSREDSAVLSFFPEKK